MDGLLVFIGERFSVEWGQQNDHINPRVVHLLKKFLELKVKCFSNLKYCDLHLGKYSWNIHLNVYVETLLVVDETFRTDF